MTRIEELEAKYKHIEGNVVNMAEMLNQLADSFQELHNRIIFILCDLDHARPMWCSKCESVVIQALHGGEPTDPNCPTCSGELIENTKAGEEE